MTESDDICLLDPRRFDSLAVDEGSIRTGQIAQVPAFVVNEQDGMMTRNVGVCHLDIIVARCPDRYVARFAHCDRLPLTSGPDGEACIGITPEADHVARRHISSRDTGVIDERAVRRLQILDAESPALDWHNQDMSR